MLALLILAGQDSTSPWVNHLVRNYGGGNIRLAGWLETVTPFYNQISLLVQPSMTEAFGLEVLEAMAHGRPVLCSMGAGAADVVPTSNQFQAGNSDQLAEKIERNRTEPPTSPKYWQDLAKPYEWTKIREQYANLWKECLAGNFSPACIRTI